MKIDPYQPCPGGKPEKIKFCCRDLLAKLERLFQLREGEQYEAYVRHLDGLLVKHSDRACLRVLRAQEGLGQGDVRAAAELVEPLLAQTPDHVLARLLSAPHAAASLGPSEGLTRWFAAIASRSGIDQDLLLLSTYRVLEALADKQVPMSYSYLAYIATDLAGPQAMEFSLLDEFWNRNSMVWQATCHPLASDPYPLPDAEWSDEYRATKELRQKLHILEEQQRLEQLVERHPAAQHAWYRLGCVRGILGETRMAVEALRKAAALEDSLDLAVLAESMAQLAEPDSTVLVQTPCLAWEVREPELLKSHLLTHPCCCPGHASELGYGHTAYMLADRPLPEPDEPLAHASIPELLAALHLFQGNADHGPVLVATAISPAGAARFPQCIHDVLGTAPGGESWLVRPAEVPRPPAELMPEFLPAMVPPRTIDPAGLREAVQQHVLQRLESWQNQPSPHLEGQTPAAALADPRLRIKLMALLLNWEAAASQELTHADELFALVRARLGLPQPAQLVIEPQLPWVPFALLSYVALDGCENKVLAAMFKRAVQAFHLVALRRLAEALQHSPQPVHLSICVRCCAYLSEKAPHPQERLDWLDRGRRAAQQTNADVVAFDVRRVQLLCGMGRWAEALAVARTAETIVRSQRRPNGRELLDALHGMIENIEQLERSEAQNAAAAQQIWTPQAQTVQAKPALWLPGEE